MGLLSILLPHIMHRQTSLGGIIMHWMLKIPPSTKWLYTNNLVMDWGYGNIQTGKLLGELVYYTVFACGPKGYSTSGVWYKERSETHCFYKELQRGEVRARDISWLLSGVLILVRSPIKGKGQNVIKWECWTWENKITDCVGREKYHPLSLHTLAEICHRIHIHATHKSHVGAFSLWVRFFFLPWCKTVSSSPVLNNSHNHWN